MSNKRQEISDAAEKISKEITVAVIPILDKYAKEGHEVLEVNIALALAIRRLIMILSLYYKVSPQSVVDNILLGISANREFYDEDFKKAFNLLY